MPLNSAKTQLRDAPCQQVTTEERKQSIEQFEASHYELSSLLKDRLLLTSNQQFTRKMNELRYYAEYGGIYTS